MSSRKVQPSDGERLDGRVVVRPSRDPDEIAPKISELDAQRAAPPNSSPVESGDGWEGLSISAQDRGCVLRLVIAMDVGLCREGPMVEGDRFETARECISYSASVTRNSSSGNQMISNPAARPGVHVVITTSPLSP